jgi:Uma2 family endonuclease
VGAALLAFLWNHVRAQRCGRIFDASTGYELASGDTLEPDVSFVSAARWQSLPQPLPEGFLPFAPDLVIEILSRSTAKRDRTEKKEIYASNGVEEYWIVDTDRCNVTIYCREGSSFDGGRLIQRGTVASRVLPGLTLTIAQVFEDIP